MSVNTASRPVSAYCRIFRLPVDCLQGGIPGARNRHQTVAQGPGTSVEGAWDTDCNGATCGSIVGAASRARGLNSSLVAPLNDTIKPLVFGFQEITMSELAERTLQVYKNIAL